MKIGLGILCVLSLVDPTWGILGATTAPSADAKVYILPIRDEIMPPLVYVVRRGVKAAIQAKADLIILDMDTNGGRVDTTEEIIRILDQFKGETVTYVNHKAFSAGTFIAVATQKIFMAPESVIGAAAPLMMMPGGGPTEMPATLEAKMNSGVRALVRARAEKNGYNVNVLEAMIDKTKELKIDGDVLNEKGQILTLTSQQAEKKYGNPPKPLLSSGTFETVNDLLARLGYAGASRIEVRPTGVERLGSWINALSPMLLILGVLGIYLEFKTPGVVLPGVIGISAFVLYFLGGYVAGLSGIEWIGIFGLGLILFGLELFAFPGVAVLGLAGALLMLGAIAMAMVDVYPSSPGLPLSFRFQFPLHDMAVNFSVTVVGCFLVIWLLSYFLPKTNLYSALVSHSVSGETSGSLLEQTQLRRIGEIGMATSMLRPGGKAQFGEELLDVISQGEPIAKGSRVRIIGHSGTEAVVEEIA